MTNKNTSSLPSFCAEYAKKYDHDRFFCTLLIPNEQRELAFRLLAFHIEITRAVALPSSWTVAGPMAGFIRLQWWRELLDGKDRTHELAPYIKEAIDHHDLLLSDLIEMIESKEVELDGITGWEQWHNLLMGSYAKVQIIIARLLGETDPQNLMAIASIAAGYEVVKIARYLPQILQSGRLPLPQFLMDQYQLQRTDDGIQISTDKTQEIRQILIQKATDYLNQGVLAQSLGKQKIGSVLLGVLAGRDLRKYQLWDHLPDKRGIGDQLAIMLANIRGKTKFVLK